MENIKIWVGIIVMVLKGMGLGSCCMQEKRGRGKTEAEGARDHGEEGAGGTGETEAAGVGEEDGL